MIAKSLLFCPYSILGAQPMHDDCSQKLVPWSWWAEKDKFTNYAQSIDSSPECHLKCIMGWYLNHVLKHIYSKLALWSLYFIVTPYTIRLYPPMFEILKKFKVVLHVQPNSYRIRNRGEKVIAKEPMNL